jgi:carboxyvinyl-carboxyphosphonate phosphorylmutase
VFDPLSTRIAEDIAYESGSLISMAVLGAPDKIVLTLTELVEQIRRMSRACELPLMVDADHGYGNALNVIRTVQELEMAGASALSIEDTLLPAAFGSDGKPQLITEAEAVGKIRAAVDARSDNRMVISGRTNLKATRDTGDAVSRIKAFEAAGVDMIFLVGVDTREQLDTLTDAVNLPFTVAASNPYVQDDLDYLASRRV